MRDFSPSDDIVVTSAGKPEPFVIPMDGNAVDVLQEIMSECEAKRAFYESHKSESGTALWGRVIEKARKFAMVNALSENPRNPCITGKGLRWAFDIAA